MFSVGQTVYHKSGKHSGIVQECDGGTVYLIQPNGVEIDLPVKDLTLIPPPEKAGPASFVLTAAPASAAVRTLTMADITPEHIKVLSVIPARTIHAVAALYEQRLAAGKFSALNVAAKLNFIAGVTEVPYRTMKEFSDRPGELGLMMGRALAASR